MKIVHREEQQGVPAQPGLVRRVLAHSSNLMLVENVIAAGTVLPIHQHPHEQILYVQRGDLRFFCQGREQILRTGDSCAIPGNTDHGVTAISDLIVMDIFTPAREDFMK